MIPYIITEYAWVFLVATVLWAAIFLLEVFWVLREKIWSLVLLLVFLNSTAFGGVLLWGVISAERGPSNISLSLYVAVIVAFTIAAASLFTLLRR